MRFSKDFPDELRLQISPSEVISKKVSLKKHGKEYTGLCPFHSEKTPSFTVNDQKGFYHCFGCAAHGDIISFVMQTEGLEFKDTIIKLANDYGIPIPFIKTQEDTQYQEVQDQEYLILEKICQFFEDNLTGYEGKTALDYLHKRGLNNNNIKKFRLGFASDSYESAINFLKKQGFTEAQMLEAGVVSKNENGQLYDKFRNRVIFPILNRRGKVIAFGGRILGDGQPKYLNSPETHLFKKGQNLYNYSNAKSAAFEHKFVCVVEGYMDVIGLDINGLSNIVAPLGTAVTADQMKLLFKITKDVVVCLDGDMAGIKAMRRVIDIALPMINSENIIRFAFLPPQTDPDDFVKLHGKTAMYDLLANAKILSQTLFEYEARDLGIVDFEAKIAPEKKAQLEVRLMDKVNLISDTNSKKYFSQYYKNQLFEIGRKQFTKKLPIASKNKIRISGDVNISEIYALNIITILAQYPKLVDYQDQYYNIREFLFEDEGLTNLKESLIDFIDHNQNCILSDIKTHLEKCPLNNDLRNKILLDGEPKYSLDNAKIRLELLILKYHHNQVSRHCGEILSKIEDIQTDYYSIKGGKQQEIFNHRTILERRILQLESDIT